MTASITQSGGKTTTASNHFIVTNNFNDVDAVAMNGDLVVTSANQTVHGEYALPSHVGAFDSINAHYDHQCFNNSCDPYDHIGYVRVKNHRGEWVELFRYCSPFGVACEADVDVTDYTSILQGLVEFEVYYEIWHGWSFNPILTFNMRKGTPDYLYSDIQPIWFGKYEFGDYLNQQPVPECDIEFAEGAEEAHLKLITTGHNWSNSSNNAYNTGNAAEFYEATHHVYVNNALKFDQHLWRECNPNPSGCQPQSGTWTYPRSGWCPGSMGLVWNYDMTAYLPQGGAHLFYQFDPNYIDQCHPNYPDCHDGQNACILCSNPDNPIDPGTPDDPDDPDNPDDPDDPDDPGTPIIPGNCHRLHYPLGGTLTLYRTPDEGYLAGTNTYGDLAKADYFQKDSTTEYLVNLKMNVGMVSGTGNVTFCIWADNNGRPGSLIASKTVSLSTIASQCYTENDPQMPTSYPQLKRRYVCQFSPSVAISGNFFAGYMLPSSGQFALVTNTGNQAANTGWEMRHDSTWVEYSDSTSWGIALTHALFPQLCDNAETNDIEEFDHSSVIYPNPTTGIVSIRLADNELSNAIVKVYDMNGKLVNLAPVMSNDQLTLDLSSLRSGLYLISIQTSKQTITKKISLIK